jgi:hypothetical protein
MDWNLAIERNREALKRVLAMLVAMAEVAGLTSPLWGGRREASGGGCDDADTPTRRSDDRRPPHKGEVKPALTLPRHLHRAILRLLRPAESAVRRLIIVMARGLVVTLGPPRPRKPKPRSIFLRKPGGTGILLPRGFRASAFPSLLWGGVRVGGRAAGTPSLPLLDPLKRYFRRRRPVANGIPRISVPGISAPFPITPRRPPAADDLLDATRLALRLQALGAALDDLPGQAKRFARWRARKRAGRTRRVWPLRPGRPPGQRRPNRRTHQVYEILNDLHGLAFDVLEHPDTS